MQGTNLTSDTYLLIQILKTQCGRSYLLLTFEIRKLRPITYVQGGKTENLLSWIGTQTHTKSRYQALKHYISSFRKLGNQYYLSVLTCKNMLHQPSAIEDKAVPNDGAYCSQENGMLGAMEGFLRKP